MINVKEVMDNEIPVIRKPVPCAEKFENRSNMLREFLKELTWNVTADVDNLPNEVIDRYNALIRCGYEIADAEYELYKAYR